MDRSALKIVVADDNQDAAMTMAMLLDRLGFQVVATHYDGASALASIRVKKPDVAILDIALPEMDGFEVAEVIRQEVDTNPRLVAVTGLSGACDRADALQAGFDAYFVKPVEADKLEELMLAYLKGGPSVG